MKVAISSPLGSLSEETGLVYLLSNYIRSISSETAQLRCNGAFSVCDRDAESGWRRTIESCVQCMHDQSALALWAGVDSIDLTAFLSPAEVEASRRWMMGLKSSELSDAELWGIKPAALCRWTMKNRFGVELPDVNNRHQEHFLRKVMLSSVRMCAATRRFNDAYSPDYIFVTGGRDFITQSLISESKKQGKNIVLFQWQLEERCVQIVHPKTQAALACELVLTGISSMRSDSKTWPLELISILDDILSFLEMPRVELLFPIAK